jgi:hypothetical protein
MTHRLKITEAELVLFHQGALPLGEILPLLRDEILAAGSRSFEDSTSSDVAPRRTRFRLGRGSSSAVSRVSKS